MQRNLAYALLLLLGVAVFSCNDDEETEEVIKAFLSFNYISEFNPELYESISLEVYNEEDELVVEFSSLSEVPEKVEVPVGKYYVIVRSDEFITNLLGVEVFTETETIEITQSGTIMVDLEMILAYVELYWGVERVQDGKEDGDPVKFKVSLLDGDGELVSNRVQNINVKLAFTGNGLNDLASTPPSSVSFKLNDKSKIISLDVADDDLIENPEEISLTISDPTIGEISVASASANILDIDIEEALWVIQAEEDGSEDGNDVEFGIKLTNEDNDDLTNATGNSLSVNISFGGTANQSDIDDTLPTSVSIEDGDFSTVVRLDVEDDDVFENDENFFAEISNPEIGEIGDADSDEVIIEDNDNFYWSIVLIQDGEEGGDDLIFQLQLKNASGFAFTNNSSKTYTVDLDYDGSASGSDFESALPGQISLTPGNSSVNLTLEVEDDASLEGTEDLEVTISNPSNGAIQNPFVATGDIIDNDASDYYLEIVDTQYGFEGSSALIFTVNLLDGDDDPITNTSGGNITADIDFSGEASQSDFTTTYPTGISISNGSSSVQVILSVDNDGFTEGTETAIATLSNPSGADLTADFSTTGYVQDDDFCSASSSNTSDEWLARFQLNTINNATGSNTYTDYTNISTELVKNSGYTATFEMGICCNGLWDEYFRIWIDYNQDGDWDDANEDLGSTFLPDASAGETTTVSFTVPSSASTGPTRLRVQQRYNQVSDPCSSFTFGEYEDYTVVIVDATSADLGEEEEPMRNTMKAMPHPVRVERNVIPVEPNSEEALKKYKK